MTNPSTGFEPYERPSPLLDPWGPFWKRELPDRVQIGIEARAAHCNARGLVHGGFFAALADQALGITAATRILARGMPMQSLLTTSLQVDYVGAARPGQWIVFDPHFAKGGKSIWFAELDITADGETVARGRATFRLLLKRTGD